MEVCPSHRASPRVPCSPSPAPCRPRRFPRRGVAWHYGDPLREQRSAETTAAIVDRSNRFVLSIAGAERLSWLHTISSQHVANLPDGASAENLSLDLNGRVEHHFVLTDLDEVTWIDTEPRYGARSAGVPAEDGVLGEGRAQDGARHGGAHPARPRHPTAPVLDALGIGELPGVYGAVAVAGGGFLRTMPWPGEHAFDLDGPPRPARPLVGGPDRGRRRSRGQLGVRGAAGGRLRPRIGLDTDERTIPHEVRWIGDHRAVHLDKGCYRGQETVARVHNLGKPPRHLVLLHLDGSADTLPQPGDAVTADGRAVAASAPS